MGKEGEDLACCYLSEKGHIVLDRNWRHGHLEIDIITLDKNGLHFVEVKSRTAPTTVDPLQNVDARKRQNLVNAALRYLHSDRRKLFSPDTELYFDIITIVFKGGESVIKYYPQAFIPLYT